MSNHRRPLSLLSYLVKTVVNESRVPSDDGSVHVDVVAGRCQRAARRCVLLCSGAGGPKTAPPDAGTRKTAEPLHVFPARSNSNYSSSRIA